MNTSIKWPRPRNDNKINEKQLNQNIDEFKVTFELIPDNSFSGDEIHLAVQPFTPTDWSPLYYSVQRTRAYSCNSQVSLSLVNF